MTNEELIEAGRLLYGDRWKQNLGKSLGIDARRISHWLDGTRPKPKDLKKKVIELIDKNQRDMQDFKKRLENYEKES